MHRNAFHPLAALAVIGALVGGPGGGTAQAAGEEGAVRSLLAAERAFAALSLEQGMDSAFLANLAADAVIFRPHPVNGREWIRSHPAPPIILSWGPAYGEVSASGDFGYTTGPSTFTDPSDSSKTTYHGHFFSIWMPDAEGKWKVVLDQGISHAPATVTLPWPAPREGRAAQSVRGERVDSLSGLVRKIDAELNADLQRNGAYAAILARAAPDIKVYRPRHLPALIPDSLKALLLLDDRTIVRQVLRSVVASSGDLAYTMGEARGADAQPVGYYTRIWRRRASGEWELALDIQSRIPPPQKEKT
jgi:ketosteroid isomerase-like protein